MSGYRGTRPRTLPVLAAALLGAAAGCAAAPEARTTGTLSISATDPSAAVAVTGRPRPAPAAIPAPTTARPAVGATSPPAGRSLGWAMGRDWERLPTSEKVVALTFDAGANADAVPSILATLAAKKVPATFFLTGDWVRSYPDAARQIAAAGHAIGNHSLSHPAFTTLDTFELNRQVTDAERLIHAAIGRPPQPLFRFPFGDRNATTVAALNATGYVAIRWTADTVGWKGTSGGMTTADVVARVLAHLGPGEIVLMHVGSHPTDGSMLDAAALPGMIDRIRAAGYGFADLTDFAR